MAQVPSRHEHTGGGKKRWRRGRIAALLLIITAVVVGVTADSSERLRDAVAPPATVSIASPQPRSREEQAYLDAILPLTERLVGEGRLLAELGAARSRDVLELRTRAQRFQATADEVDRVERSIGVPPRLTRFSRSLNHGIASALSAIEAAERAVVRFEWDEVQVAVTTFDQAIDEIAVAIDLVEHA